VVSGRAYGSQWDVIARQIDPLKAIVTLEVAKGVSLLFPVREIGVHEVRDPPFGAGSDRMSDKGIGWSFVSMLDQRDDIQQARLRSTFITQQFDESDQFLSEICPYEDAPIEVRSLLLMHGLEILSEVWKALSLPNGALVVDLPNSPNEGFIELHFANL